MKRKYYILTIGLLLTYIGDLIFMTSSAIYIYDKTEDALQVSLIYIVRTFSSLLLLLFGGSVVDRLNAKKTMIVLDFIRAILVIIFILNLNNFSILYLIIFIHGALGSFYGTALRVVLKYYSDRLGHTYVNQRFSVVFWLGSIIGTYLSGLIIVKTDYYWPFVIDATTFVLCGIFTMIIYFNHDYTKSIQSKISFYDDIVNSIKTIKSNSKLNSIVIFNTFISVLQTAITSFQIFFVSEILRASSEIYSAIKSIEMFGLFIGSVSFSYILSRFKHEYNLMNLSVTLIFLSFGVYSIFVNNIIMAMCLMLIYGIGNTLFDIITTNIIQENIETEVIGRISNVMGILPKIATIVTLPIFSLINNFFGVKILFISLTIFMFLIFVYFYKRIFVKSI